MKILILEDDAERTKIFKRNLIGNEVIVVDNVQECIDYLKSDEFTAIMLDHDLGGQTYQDPSEVTGYGVVKWLVANKDRCPKQVFVHSLNGPAAKMMVELFADNDIDAQYIPFLWLKLA